MVRPRVRLHSPMLKINELKVNELTASSYLSAQALRSL